VSEPACAAAAARIADRPSRTAPATGYDYVPKELSAEVSGAAIEFQLAAPETLINTLADAIAERLGAPSSATPQSPWLDVPGAAAYLNSTSDAVRKAAQRGQFPAYQPLGPGTKWFFHRDELDAFIFASPAGAN